MKTPNVERNSFVKFSHKKQAFDLYQTSTTKSHTVECHYNADAWVQPNAMTDRAIFCPKMDPTRRKNPYTKYSEGFVDIGIHE